MAATWEEIHEWLMRGKREGATHVIIVCDTFEWEDYPVYVKPDENAPAKVEEYRGKSMQKVMEVYNLALDIDAQLKEYKAGQSRAWHL